jgi:hypothetical protein
MQVGFFRGEGFFAWLVRVWTWSNYCHCELRFSDGVFFGSTLNDSWKTAFHGYDEKWAASKAWMFVDVPVTPEQEASIRAWCAKESDCSYDWFGLILSQVMCWNRQDPNKWFCSEVVAAALQQVGLLPPKPPAVRYAPAGRRGVLKALLEILGRAPGANG